MSQFDTIISLIEGLRTDVNGAVARIHERIDDQAEATTELMLFKARVEGVLLATRFGMPLFARIVIPLGSAVLGATAAQLL